jgi:ribosome recycling factor
MAQAMIEAKRGDFDKAVSFLEGELLKLRTGRAHPGLVEDLLVDYYGTMTPIKQMASVSVPEPRQILISPWDKGALAKIEATIRESDLGLNPLNDGVGVRVVLPALTEERRKDLVKVLNTKAEEARIAIRSVREDIWKDIQEAEQNGEMGEDEKFRGKEDLQKVVDEYNARIEGLRDKKEQEIMTV